MHELCERGPPGHRFNHPAPGRFETMAEGVTGAVLFLMAVLGAVALAVRLFRSLARTVLRAAEAAAADGLVEASARRGDLTGMQEGREVGRQALASRRRAGWAAAFWLVWLVLPLVFDVVPLAYALAAPLWLIPFDPPNRPERDPSR